LNRAAILAAGILMAGAAYAQTPQIVKSITVKGNNSISSEAILAAMTVQQGKAFLQSDATADEQNLLNLGYFQAVKVFSTDASASEVDVTVEVSENPIVKEVRVVGNSVLTTEEITEIVKLHQTMGQILNNRNARPIRTAIEDAYSKKGYFVQIQQMEPDPSNENILLINLLEPRVGQIILKGLDRTNPKIVRRIMRTEPGGPLSTDVWRRDLEELYSTQWFDKIDPAQPAATDKPGVYDLVVDFKEARTAMITAGVALDPQSRLVGTFQVNDTNFRGLGQTVGAQLSQSTVGGGLSGELGYTNRFFDSHNTVFNATLFSKVVYNFTGSGTTSLFGDSGSQFDERRTGFTFNFNRPMNDRYRVGIGLSAQTINTINISDDPGFEFIQQDGDLASLMLFFEYDVRRPTQEPYAGRYFRISVEPGYSNIREIGGNVASDTDVLGSHAFVRTATEYRQYWSKPLKPDAKLDDPRQVLAVRARYAFISGQVPFFEQLFVGGSNSLRGYENQRFWGNQSFLATVEYRYGFKKSLNLIGFVDYGGAWGGYGKLRDFEQFDDPHLKLGYGLGVSFKTPIGPIRIDYAMNEEGRGRTHFSFGTSF
jgi:outer membrane protein insertion porin family